MRLITMSRWRRWSFLVAVLVVVAASMTSCEGGGPGVAAPQRLSDSERSGSADEPAAAAAPGCRHRPPAAAPAEGADMAQASAAIGDLWHSYSGAGRDEQKSEPGTPPGLHVGVIGQVGDFERGWTVVVDPSVRDPEEVRNRLAQVLDLETMRAIEVKASCAPAASLVDAWAAVAARSWYPRRGDWGYSVRVDPASESVVVTLDVEAAGRAVIEDLQGLAPGAITIRNARVERLGTPGDRNDASPSESGRDFRCWGPPDPPGPPLASYGDVLPNTFVKVRGSRGRPEPLSSFVVTGRIVAVNEGRAWRPREVRFDHPAATWKAVHATVAVEEIVATADPSMQVPSEVTVAFTLEGFERLAPARQQLVSDQLLVLPLFRWAGVDYQSDLWAVVPVNSSLLAEVAPDGDLSLPCIPRRHEERLLEQVKSLTDLRAAVRAPKRIIEIEPVVIL